MFIFPVQRHSLKVLALALQRLGVGLENKVSMKMGHRSFQRTAQGGTMLSVLSNYGSRFLHPFPIFLPPFHHHHPPTGLNRPSNDTLECSLGTWDCDLVWKQVLRRCGHVRVRSHWRVGWCLCNRRPRVSWRWSAEEEQQNQISVINLMEER